MFNESYLYLYLLSCCFVFCTKNTTLRIEPANPLIQPIMSIVGMVTSLANYILLIFCLFHADYWWYAPAMWVIGFVLTILIPPTKIEMIMGYLGVIVAPLCTIFAYIDLLGSAL